MQIIQELRNDIVDEKVTLSTTLRKAKVLAFQLKHDALKDWLDKELNGYKEDDPELPDYRKLNNVQSFGDFHELYFGRRTLMNFHIPSAQVPNFARDYANGFLVTDSVRAIESIVADTDNKMFRLLWDANVLAAVSDKIIPGFQCIHAWRALNVHQFVHVLETIRNRLLNFILELQELQPAITTSDDAIAHIPREQVNNIFQTIIHGDAVITNANSITQNSQQNIVMNDLTALADFMKSIGIQNDDIKELEEAIKQDGAIAEQGTFGKKVAKWSGKMFQKAAEGTWKVGLDVAAKLLSNALSKYYGWEK